MQSRLIVALCVVGCAYGIQAQPHVGTERNIEGYYEDMSPSQLMREAYGKLYNLIDTFSPNEIRILREWLPRFALACFRRHVGSLPDIELQIERMRVEISTFTLKELIDFTHVKHDAIISHLSEDRIKYLRRMVIKFMLDTKPKILLYTRLGWPIDVTIVELKHIIHQIKHKLDILTTGEIQLTNAIINIIKRADEQLVKNNHKKEVDQMIAHTPYEKLYSFNLRELGQEAGYRAEIDDLEECLIYFHFFFTF
uniref:NR LBD domain-containing protein n=1 Tax=Panagrellus redivivus TaxID=6233 RepID=A0A7E4UP47_PANRE